MVARRKNSAQGRVLFLKPIVEVVNLFTALTEEGPVASMNQEITRRNVYRPVKFVRITNESDFQLRLPL